MRGVEQRGRRTRTGLNRRGLSIERGTTSRSGRLRLPLQQFGATTASGLANEAVGKAKQDIGNVVGSDKLKTEGAAQELKGDAQKATGDAKAAVKDATNKAAAAINKNL
jgi:uncharacterized protein YjbJ (UPF0337 family)